MRRASMHACALELTVHQPHHSPHSQSRLPTTPAAYEPRERSSWCTRFITGSLDGSYLRTRVASVRGGMASEEEWRARWAAHKCESAVPPSCPGHRARTGCRGRGSRAPWAAGGGGDSARAECPPPSAARQRHGDGQHGQVHKDERTNATDPSPSHRSRSLSHKTTRRRTHPLVHEDDADVAAGHELGELGRHVRRLGGCAREDSNAPLPKPTSASHPQLPSPHTASLPTHGSPSTEATRAPPPRNAAFASFAVPPRARSSSPRALGLALPRVPTPPRLLSPPHPLLPHSFPLHRAPHAP